MTRREAREAAFCLVFEKSFKGDDSGETVLANTVRLKAAPGEMEKLTLKAANLQDVTGPITVSLEVL